MWVVMVIRYQVQTGIDKCRDVIYNAWHIATDILGNAPLMLVLALTKKAIPDPVAQWIERQFAEL